MRHLGRLLVVGALVLLAGGCGSGSRDVVRIGIIGDCYGPNTADRENQEAGAGLAFIERGAKPTSGKPSDGVGSITVAGKRVELIGDCEFFGSYVSSLAAVRRLVEQRHAQIVLIGASVVDDLALRLYPRHQQDVTFLSTGLPPSTGREEPNIFNVNPDLRQGVAGLGAYAYKKLGWRTAVTFGEDDPLGWSLAAGFVAEFCSLGGKVVQRAWAPITVTDWSPYVKKIPPGVDGVALTAGTQATDTFFSAYKKVQPDLAGHVVMSGVPLALGARPRGILAAGFLPFSWDAPAWTAYRARFLKAFPSYRGFVAGPGDIYLNDAVNLTLTALGRVHGDLSDGGRKFRATLATTRIQTPVGPLQVGENHHVVISNFLMRVEKGPDGTLVPLVVGLVPGVEDSFGGYFSASSPPDSETQPVCRKGHVPAWAR